MATIPRPQAGQVICYRYLWKREADKGLVEGQKERPCAVVVALAGSASEPRAVVAPITHTKPADPETAIKLTPATQRRLGLDTDQSWIIASEVNVFHWPGPDIAQTPTGQYIYGELPEVVFKALKEKILAFAPRRLVNRSD